MKFRVNYFGEAILCEGAWGDVTFHFTLMPRELELRTQSMPRVFFVRMEPVVPPFPRGLLQIIPLALDEGEQSINFVVQGLHNVPKVEIIRAHLMRRPALMALLDGPDFTLI